MPKKLKRGDKGYKYKNMDATRWKSLIVPREMYDELQVIKDVEGRTLSGQVRTIYRMWKNDHLSKKDQAFIKHKVVEMQGKQRAKIRGNKPAEEPVYPDEMPGMAEEVAED